MSLFIVIMAVLLVSLLALTCLLVYRNGGDEALSGICGMVSASAFGTAT
jgi:hypothetical protein